MFGFPDSVQWRSLPTPDLVYGRCSGGVVKVLTNVQKFIDHVDCPRCSGTKVVYFVEGDKIVKEGCDFYGEYYRAADRAMAYAGEYVDGKGRLAE